jgi:hypothetical protein
MPVTIIKKSQDQLFPLIPLMCHPSPLQKHPLCLSLVEEVTKQSKKRTQYVSTLAQINLFDPFIVMAVTLSLFSECS